MMHWTSTTWVHRQFRVSPRVCSFAKISFFWVQTSLNQFKPAESPTGGESCIATQIGRRWRASSWASGWSVLECTQRCERGRHIWMCLWPVLHQTERSDLTWFDQKNNNKKQLSAAFLKGGHFHTAESLAKPLTLDKGWYGYFQMRLFMWNKHEILVHAQDDS